MIYFRSKQKSKLCAINSMGINTGNQFTPYYKKTSLRLIQEWIIKGGQG